MSCVAYSRSKYHYRWATRLDYRILDRIYTFNVRVGTWTTCVTVYQFLRVGTIVQKPINERRYEYDKMELLSRNSFFHHVQSRGKWLREDDPLPKMLYSTANVAFYSFTKVPLSIIKAEVLQKFLFLTKADFRIFLFSNEWIVQCESNFGEKIRKTTNFRKIWKFPKPIGDIWGKKIKVRRPCFITYIKTSSSTRFTKMK